MYKGFLVLTSTPLGISVGDFLSFSSEMHFGTVVFHLQTESFSKLTYIKNFHSGEGRRHKYIKHNT